MNLNVPMTTTAPRETLGFQAEVKQLLHLMVHSLWRRDLPARAGVERLETPATSFVSKRSPILRFSRAIPI